MEPYATVVISYRDPGLLTGVLARLGAQNVPPALVVVVDNGGDLPADVVETSPLAQSTVLVRRPENPGYGAAVNVARALVVQRGIGRLLVLTHDAVFGPDLGTGLGGALDDDGTGAVGPLLHWVSDPSRVFTAGGRLTRGGRAWNTVVPRSVTEPYPVDWLDGAIVMYSVAALDRIGWLDEAYFLYFEDVDTSWRLRQAGFQVAVAPAVVAQQQPGAHPMRLGIRNMTLFARKARLPLVPHLGAVSRRTAEEAVYRVLHRRSPDVLDAWRGWREGRRGITGRPV
ncbi:glycosyltransferase family 2 protein [Xylanimonas protaetiae]|uniref:Glycosyltransferase family 2 protein n=1 Tax=Xylanimonas protaetiae TaxID=2509457 RepID=A0A4P6F3X4_9MICO|nr:glycosyltransferase family 2 protein [Xylanimonas protaetiae]QAY68899.1 glycosyltransferase family 2 protein [Xylanimonas protaetiae]